MGKTFLIPAAFLAAVAACPAAAQTVTASRTVSYAGLDLGTRAGRARFDRRIADAVETLCGSYASVASSETRDIDRCRAAAGTDFRRQLAALQSRSARVALGSR